MFWYLSLQVCAQSLVGNFEKAIHYWAHVSQSQASGHAEVGFLDVSYRTEDVYIYISLCVPTCLCQAYSWWLWRDKGLAAVKQAHGFVYFRAGAGTWNAPSWGYKTATPTSAAYENRCQEDFYYGIVRKIRLSSSQAAGYWNVFCVGQGTEI